jgi:hypothetical protein
LIVAKKKWWEISPRGRGIASAAFSGMDDMFHGTAKQAHEIREEQNRKVVSTSNEGDPLKITIKRPPSEN